MKIFCIKSKFCFLILICFGCIFIIIGSLLLRNMQEKKSVLSGASLQSTLDTSENTSILELNDAIITRLLLDYLPENIPFSNLVVHISSDGNIKLDCTSGGSALLNFIKKNRSDISPSLKLIMKLLPESVPVSVNLRISVDSQTGHLSLKANDFSINNIELSGSILPNELEVDINKAVNSLLSKSGKKIDSINISDGKILMNLA